MFGDPVRNEKGWEIKKLKDVCIKITDGTHHSPEAQLEGFPYVTAKHVRKNSLDFYSNPTYISKDAHDKIYERCDPDFGDVLLIKDGATTGVACINDFKEPISLLSSLALIKPNFDKLSNYFLSYWFNHEGVKEKLINEFMAGAAIRRYTLKKINTFSIGLPPITLQNQFADHIKAIEAQKALAKKAMEKSEDLFNSQLQKAFNGSLLIN